MTEYTLHLGDCLEVMATLPDNSIDAVVTDPPYGLGFMGKHWDHGVPGVEFWVQALRVLKPGGHLLAFGGTRTYHRMAVAIEDAGFEIRDQIQWLYGSGFPKSLDVSKAIDAAAGAEREDAIKGGHKGMHRIQDRWSNEHNQLKKTVTPQINMGAMTRGTPATPDAERWAGWGTALKPANEPICMARKPFPGTVAANVLAWGTGAINVDGCRVGTESTPRKDPMNGNLTNAHMEMRPWMKRRIEAGEPLKGDFDGSQGRWPANVIHDGSGEVVGLFPVTESHGGGTSQKMKGWDKPTGKRVSIPVFAESGSAARFFYCAKASKAERDAGLEGEFSLYRQVDGVKAKGVHRYGAGIGEGIAPKAPAYDRNHHPTVKPIALMRYLCRLITSPGGVVLDPFMGSGSTGCGAVLEGLRFVGIEREAEYLEIAQRRIEYWAASVRLPLLAMAAD